MPHLFKSISKKFNISEERVKYIYRKDKNLNIFIKNLSIECNVSEKNVKKTLKKIKEKKNIKKISKECNINKKDLRELLKSLREIECPICFENININTNTIACSNKHKFHEECISQTYLHTCPMCRVALTLHKNISDKIQKNIDDKKAQDIIDQTRILIANHQRELIEHMREQMRINYQISQLQVLPLFH